MNSASLLGQMIDKVLVNRVLGEGAAGVVYKGYHTTLGLDVAVKVLKRMPSEEENTLYRQRFRREAQLAAKLHHASLVRVLDFGDHDGAPYLVMDYVDGFSLAEFVKRRPGPIDEKTVLKVLLAVSSGLAVAHEAGIIHRDLKPSNILISRSGQLKIVDMGLAREEGMEHLTMDQVVVGTPAYIAPECLSPGGKADQRSDIYALGVLGYRMAFGKKPYDGTLQEMVLGHLAGNASFNEPHQCSQLTIAMIQRMMSSNPEFRFQTSGDVVRHIREVVAPRIASMKTAPVAVAAGAGDSSSQSVSRVSDFRGIASFLELRLGEAASQKDGGTIIHTTARERYIIWAMLAGTFAAAGLGYAFFS